MTRYRQLDGDAKAFQNRPQPAEYYNTDCGHKKSFAKALAESPNRMSIMRSGTQRLGTSKSTEQSTPFGVYCLDTAHRKNLASCVRDSRRFYAASFASPLLERSLATPTAAPDVVYDALTLTNGAAPTFATSVESSPLRFSILQSKATKVAKVQQTDAPDVVYPTDALHKASMATCIRDSPILYSNIARSKSQRAPLTKPSACPTDIGPGSYDFPVPSDVRSSLLLNQSPLSSMLSQGPRLATDNADPTKNLGSTWKAAHDLAHWRKGTSISKAEYLRPQYLPVSYAT